MDQSEAALSTVEAWWKKSFDISKDNNDPLFSLFTTSFETIMIYLSQSIDYEGMQQSVASLDEQRKLALLSEDKYDPLRHISFGMIELVQAILLRDTRKLEEMIKSGYIPVPNVPNFNLSLPLEPKEEEIEDFNSFSAENETTRMDDIALEENNSLNELEKQENIDEFVDTMSPIEDEAMTEKDSPNDQSMKEKVVGNKDPAPNLLLEKERKSARRVTRPVKYKDSMEELDEYEDEPNVKKTRLDSDKQKKTKDEKKKPSNKVNSLSEAVARKQSIQAKRSETVLECIECEFRTEVVGTWITHLRLKHSTTPFLTGLVLRCACGDESTSPQHSFKCNISNFIVIRKKDEPIRRLEDVAARQVKCILCEAYPKTVQGYIKHLSKHHKEKSTLNANGIYLICSCGFEIMSDTRNSMQHIKSCEGSEFALHELKDKIHSTPQCILCEAYPKTSNGYIQHLKNYHKDKSTLHSNGIYLLCVCGLEVRTSHGYLSHDKKCNGRQYTLHKVDDEEDNSE